MGYDELSEDTWLLLVKWADKIIFLDEEMHKKAKWFNTKYLEKMMLFDVGEDVWFDSKHQQLVHKLYKELSRHPELFDIS